MLKFHSVVSMSGRALVRLAPVMLVGLAAPAAAQVATPVVALPHDGDFVGGLGPNSPQRNGQPYICKTAPLPGSTRVTAASSTFPMRLQVYAGEACAGAPIFTVSATQAGQAIWLQLDAGLSYRRSVAFSSADPSQRGVFVSESRFEPWLVTGAPSGGGVQPAAPAMGSLARPLPPGPVDETDELTSDDPSCLAAYGAWAADPGGYTVRLTKRQPEDYRRRAAQLPTPRDDDQRLMADVRRELFAARIMTLNKAADITRLAYACDLRFGFTPLTLADN